MTKPAPEPPGSTCTERSMLRLWSALSGRRAYDFCIARCLQYLALASTRTPTATLGDILHRTHGRPFPTRREDAPCSVEVTEKEHGDSICWFEYFNAYIAFSWTILVSKPSDKNPIGGFRREPVLDHQTQRLSRASQSPLLQCACVTGCLRCAALRDNRNDVTYRTNPNGLCIRCNSSI